MPSVAILMCTFNGARFLRSQLASIERQDFQNWRLVASDDGSTDDTQGILTQFQLRHGPERVEIRNGPRRGFVSNFLSLVCDATMRADYYAFSDQDDIWQPGKLSRAIEWLHTHNLEKPAFYCSRTRLIDEHDREIGLSPLFSKQPTFENALVQSIAGGNTMVFNGSVRRLLQIGGVSLDIAAHDWWLYLVTTACGGTVFYDRWPSTDYRAHGDNRIGHNSGWANRLARFRLMLHGQLRVWTAANIGGLERLRPHMTPENRATLDLFVAARDQSIVKRLWGIAKSGVHRQTLLGNLGLMAAAIAKKI